jgi:hypothetical protein
MLEPQAANDRMPIRVAVVGVAPLDHMERLFTPPRGGEALRHPIEDELLTKSFWRGDRL